jgi:ferredoxin
MDETTKTTYTANDAWEGEYLTDITKRHGIPVKMRCGSWDPHERNYGHGSQCTSCACVLEPRFAEQCIPPDTTEEARLRDLSIERPVSWNERLSCSVEMTPALNGMTVYLPRLHLEEDMDDVEMELYEVDSSAALERVLTDSPQNKKSHY